MVGLVIVFATLLVFPLCSMMGAFGDPAGLPTHARGASDAADRTEKGLPE